MKKINLPQNPMTNEIMKTLEDGEIRVFTASPFCVVLNSDDVDFTLCSFKNQSELNTFIENHFESPGGWSIYGVYRRGIPMKVDVKITVNYDGYDPEEEEQRFRNQTANMTPREYQAFIDSWNGGGA